MGKGRRRGGGRRWQHTVEFRVQQGLLAVAQQLGGAEELYLFLCPRHKLFESATQVVAQCLLGYTDALLVGVGHRTESDTSKGHAMLEHEHQRVQACGAHHRVVGMNRQTGLQLRVQLASKVRLG